MRTVFCHISAPGGAAELQYVGVCTCTLHTPTATHLELDCALACHVCGALGGLVCAMRPHACILITAFTQICCRYAFETCHMNEPSVHIPVIESIPRREAWSTGGELGAKGELHERARGQRHQSPAMSTHGQHATRGLRSGSTGHRQILEVHGRAWPSRCRQV